MPRISLPLLTLVLTAALLTAGSATADTPTNVAWPQFRGPSGDGVVQGSSVPQEFGEDIAVTWRTSLPGKAWSSPVVAGDSIWLTTAIERLPTDDERIALLRNTDNDEKKFKSLAIAKSIELKLIQLDLKSGSVQSTTDLVTVEQPDAIHSLNSYASPTPVVDGSNIFCHFGTFGTFCLDQKTREVVWSRTFPLQHAVGPGSSPFLYKDLLILIQDGMEQQYVIGLDKKTGDQRWKTPRPPMRANNGDQKKSYCTPVLMTDSNGREQLVCLASQWILGLNPQTGKELWRLDHGNGFSVVPRPVVNGDVVIFATGYGKPQLWAVDASGSGDVTNTHAKWTVKKGIPAKPSPLLLDGLVYVVEDNGVASCFQADDGQEVWKKRLGGKFSASPLFVGGVIYFANQDGEVFLVKPGRDYELLRTNKVDGQIMASPAVVASSLILRTDKAVYRFD